MRFAKGHGTENDFVLVPDPDGAVDLDAATVARICDRRGGIGADGLIRVVRSGAAGVGLGDEAPEWFMDYRNADGSIAEMCGNGVRVFAHYLRASGLEDRSAFTVGSRAGARPVVVHEGGPTRGEVTVEMGPVRRLGRSGATIGGREVKGLGIDVGNPHLACVLADLTPETLRGLDISAPVYDREFFPGGVNIEIVTPLRDGTVNMRVNERGVGETRSCGTGTVAAAAAALESAGQDTGEVKVRVPGGEVTVTLTSESSYLRGPSVLVAAGEIAGTWWEAAV